MRRYLLAAVIILFACALWGIVHTLSVVAPEQSKTPTIDVPAAPVTSVNGLTVHTPTNNEMITSPLVVSGTAKGGWYFEGSFPMVLVDSNGTTIATSHVQAEGDWMSSSAVPFTGTLTFPIDPATVGKHFGTLILKNDNASGDPQFDKSVSIKVQW